MKTLSAPAVQSRRLALLITVVLVSALLVASPLAGDAAHASNSSSASKLLAAVNAHRVGIPVVKLKTNKYLTSYAYQHAKAAATCTSCHFLVHDLAPQNPDTHVWETFQVKGSSATSRVTKAMNSLLASYKTDVDAAAWNYGAIGWYEKGSTAYVTLVGAEYTALPFDSLGTMTLSSRPVVGKAITAHISGFSPAPTSYDYAWRAGPYTILGVSTLTPTAVTLGAHWTLTVVAHRAGYWSPRLVATTTHKVAEGTITAPRHEQIIGHRNVNSGIAALNTGWAYPSGSTLTFTWYRNDRVVPGVTTSFYNFTAADLGKRIDVKAVVSAVGYRSGTVRTHTRIMVGNPLIPYTTAANLTGQQIVGYVLTSTSPTFAVTPSSRSVQWYANGHRISGANHSTFRIPGSDAGKVIYFIVTAHAHGYAATTIRSARTNPIAKGTIHVIAGSSLTGDEIAGHTVSASAGEYDPSSVAVSYQWYSGTHKISRATHRHHLVKASDLKAQLLLQITVKKTGYTTLRGFYSE